MSKRQKTGWLIVGALLLLLVLLNFVSFWAARSTTEANHTLSTYRLGEALPQNMLPGFTLYYAVSGEDQLSAALQTVLEDQTSVGTATAVSAASSNQPAPFLLVEVVPDRLWTPIYGRATVNAQIYFAYDGDAPWPLDEPVHLQVSPAIKADGEFTLVDNSWGLISKPAYTDHLAQALAEEIAAALQDDVFRMP